MSGLNTTLSGVGAGSFSDRKFYDDLPGLGILLAMSLTVTIIAVLEFEYARRLKRLQYLYTPRCSLIKNPSPLPPSGFLAWLRPTMAFSESWYLENVGLDAVMYLRFLRMALRICVITGFVAAVFLLPINFYGRPDEGCPLEQPASGPLSNLLNNTQTGGVEDSTSFHSTNSVARFSIDNICKGSNWFWVHALMTWVVSITTMYQLYRESWAYMMLRRAYLVAKGQQGAIHLRTIMVSQLPSDLQEDTALKTFFEAMGCGKVLNAKVVRHMGGLARKIDRREKILSQLEVAHIQLARNIANGLQKSAKEKENSAISSNTELFKVEVVTGDAEKKDDSFVDLASSENGATNIRPALMPPSLGNLSASNHENSGSSPITPTSASSESKARHERPQSETNASDDLLSLASSFPTSKSSIDTPFPWDAISSISRSALDRYQPSRPPPVFANLLRRLLRKSPIPETDEAIPIPRTNKSRTRRKKGNRKRDGNMDDDESGNSGSDTDLDQVWDSQDPDGIVARPLIDKLVLKYHYLDRRVRDLRQKAFRSTQSVNATEGGNAPLRRNLASSTSTNNHLPSPDFSLPSRVNSASPTTPNSTGPGSSTSPAGLEIPRNKPYDTYFPETPVSPFDMTTIPALRPLTPGTFNSANTWNSANTNGTSTPAPRQIFRPTSTGFVTFHSHVSASLAAQSIVRGVPHSCTTRMAPEPRDIIWENLCLQVPGALKYDLLRRIAVFIACWAVIILWLFPNSAIFTLTVQDLLTNENQSGVLGLFGSQKNEWIINLMTSTLPTALTAMQQVVMPNIFWGLTLLERPTTYSSLEEKVLKRYYQWAFFNIFVLFMFARAIGYAIITGIQNPTQILLLLARFLPEGSTFFINFVLFSTCLHSLELLQLGAPLVAAAFVTSSKVSGSPRQLHRNTFPLSFPYYYYYPNHTLIFSLGLIYSTINPLILLAAAAYFAFANVVFRYQFAFAYVRRYEGAGRLWIVMVRHVTGGLVLYQLTILGEMLLKGAFTPLFILLPLFAATISFDMYWKRTFLRRTKYLSMDTGLQLPDLDDENLTAMSPGASAAAASEESPEVPTSDSKDPVPSKHWPRNSTQENRAEEEAYAHRSASWAYPGKNEEWGRQVFAVAEALNAAEARGDSATIPVEVPMVSGTGSISAKYPGTSSRSAGLTKELSSYFTSSDSTGGHAVSSGMIPKVVVVKPVSADAVVPESSLRTSSSTSSMAPHSTPSVSTQITSRLRPFLNVALPSLTSPVTLLTSTFTFLQHETPSTSPHNVVPPNSYQPPPPPKQPHHLQDEDSPYQTYTHPCLIRPLPTRLWLPVNPLQQKIDLDETILFDKVIVSSRALRDAKRVQDGDYLQERVRARMWKERKSKELEEREGKGKGKRTRKKREVPRMGKWRQKRVDEGVLTSTASVIAWGMGIDLGGGEEDAEGGTVPSGRATGTTSESVAGVGRGVQSRETEKRTPEGMHKRTAETPKTDRRFSARSALAGSSSEPRTAREISVQTRKCSLSSRRRGDRRYPQNREAAGYQREPPRSVLQVDRLETASGTPTGVFLSGLESEEWEELSSGESEY